MDAPEPGKVLRPPSARLAWSVPERYGKGWEAWQPSQAAYRRSYVHPDRWGLVVDACGSTGNGSPIERYEVRVRGVGFDYATGYAGGACRRAFTELPRLGEYEVTLGVRTAAGSTDSTTTRATLRDWLIVSVGDSMASGEGSPDATGDYDLLTDIGSFGDKLRFVRNLLLGHPRPASHPDFKVRTNRPVRWRDKRCHRSARAGHAVFAQRLEARDPHSSVTFLSLACSGAKIAHVRGSSYAGQEVPANPRPASLRAQFHVLRDLVRSRVTARRSAVAQPGETLATGRRIDAVLMSIGINDLGFSGIVKACASNPVVPGAPGDPSCVTGSGVYREIRKLALGYSQLARQLRELGAAETYVTDYPAAPFGRDRGGCGLLGLRNVGISSAEARRMFEVGQTFNARIRDSANAHGWNFVDGMTDAFLGRDYCRPAGERFFVRLEESIAHQGVEHGTAHPNPRGHRAMANLLTRAVVVGQRPYPYGRTKLTIEAIKVGDEYIGRPESVDVHFRRSASEVVTRRVGVPYHGRWAYPRDLSFALDVHDAPRPPRFATALDFAVSVVNSSAKVQARHTSRDSYGVGVHELSHPNGAVRIRYRVEAERIEDPDAPQRPEFAR